jgi:hypothetical protein
MVIGRSIITGNGKMCAEDVHVGMLYTKINLYCIYSNIKRFKSKTTPPPPKHLCQGKVYLSKSKVTPKNETLPRRNILLLLSYAEYTKHVRSYLSLPIIVTGFIFAVSAFIFLILLTFQSVSL